jgi:hypothetical protein
MIAVLFVEDEATSRRVRSDTLPCGFDRCSIVTNTFRIFYKYTSNDLLVLVRPEPERWSTAICGRRSSSNDIKTSRAIGLDAGLENASLSPSMTVTVTIIADIFYMIINF